MAKTKVEQFRESDELKHKSKFDPDEFELVKKKKKLGTPLTHDPKFKGPTKNRSCTDILCCLIFLIFIAGLVVVGYFGFLYGDPENLLHPVNSEGEMCGRGNQKGKPYLFFFDLVACGKMGVGVFVTGCPTPQTCVSKCPTEDFFFVKDAGVLASDAADMKYCKSTADLSGTKTPHELTRDDECPAYFLKSSPVINRCVPDVLKDFMENGGNLLEKIEALLTDGSFEDSTGANVTNSELSQGLDVYGLFLKAKEYAEKIVEDIVSSWWMMLIILLLSMILALIWIFIMRWIAGVMVWFTIFAFLGLFGFLGAYSLLEYKNITDSQTVSEFTLSMAGLNLKISKAKMFLAIGIIASVIFAIMLLILLFLCSRIRIAIALIKEASRAVGKMMFTLIFPLIPFLLQLVVLCLCLTLAVFLASTGRADSLDFSNSSQYKNENGTYNYDKIKSATSQFFGSACPEDDSVNTTQTVQSEFCTFLKSQEENFTLYAQIYNIFMLFWLMNFVVALGQLTLAGAFSSYYWAYEKPKDLPAFPLSYAFGRSFRYHLGSIAFGSFIIAVVQIIRLVLEYIDAKIKGKENPVAKFMVKCFKCCMWCLEKFLKFLNKNAYIMIAIHGKNFCSSAKDAFCLIMRNIVRVAVVDKITDFLMLVAKLVIVGATAAGAYFFFSGSLSFLADFTPTLNFFVVPIILVTLVSYVIASCFFSVYSMAVDTLFLCFLEDLERNDGSPEKPYFMSKDLMNVLGKKNAIDKEKKKAAADNNEF